MLSSNNLILNSDETISVFYELCLSSLLYLLNEIQENALTLQYDRKQFKLTFDVPSEYSLCYMSGISIHLIYFIVFLTITPLQK